MKPNYCFYEFAELGSRILRLSNGPINNLEFKRSFLRPSGPKIDEWNFNWLFYWYNYSLDVIK
jgi:hypothetical protein